MKDPKGIALWSLGSAAFVASAEKEPRVLTRGG